MQTREDLLDALMADDALMEFMQSGSAYGENAPEDDEEQWLARGKELVDAVAQVGIDWRRGVAGKN